jgi:hypothetical protein
MNDQTSRQKHLEALLYDLDLLKNEIAQNLKQKSLVFSNPVIQRKSQEAKRFYTSYKKDIRLDQIRYGQSFIRQWV